MITNSSFPGAVRAATFDRLSTPGYRGPVALAVLLAVVAAAPEGSVHGTVATAVVVAGFFVQVPVVLLATVGTPGVVVLALGLAGLAASPAVRRRVRRLPRPGNSVLLGCALASGAVVLGFSVPGEDYGLLGLGLFALALLPFAWFAWIARQTVRAAAEPAGEAGTVRRRGSWRWVAGPLLVGAAALSISQDVPREARFSVSRPALTSYAEQALAVGATDRAPAWIGGYPVQDTELVDGGVRFAVTGSGVFAHHGYAYFPSGGPTGHPSRYTQVDGRWYSWSGPDHF
ncbi:hypothetical protein ABZW03_28570 [Kitasatospora sp. NPDC004799]|uniref:hypothetical protein n=1 Tax=Kitasatospora sp. NPDC004799 TaxID=3154460 RepID=UPI0033ADF75A